jgi:hypothetical protein
MSPVRPPGDAMPKEQLPVDKDRIEGRWAHSKTPWAGEGRDQRQMTQPYQFGAEI